MTFQRLVQIAEAPLARPHCNLREAPLGYITCNAANPHHLARFVVDRESDIQNPPHLSVRSNDAVLVSHAFAGEQPRHARQADLAILRMEVFSPTLDVGDDNVTRSTPDAFKGRAEIL